MTADAVVLSPDAPLAPGAHQVVLGVADLAGNPASAAWSFTIVTDTPEVAIGHPVDGSLTNQATVEVLGTVTSGWPIAAVLVNGQPATLDGEAFSITQPLEQGFNSIFVVATGAFGGQGVASVGLSLDSVPPQLVLSVPEPGRLVNGDSVRVVGEVSDASGIGTVTVDGEPVTVTGGLFATEVELTQQGPKTLLVEARDLAGNSAEVSRQVVRFSLPEVTITTPTDLAFVAATTVAVAGTVSDDVVAVAVNGVAASLDGASFLAEGVPLIEGGNVIAATAADVLGHVATATIHVVRDLTPPRVAIYHPASGATVYQGTVSVSGLVNDIVPGTVNASEATVSSWPPTAVREIASVHR